MAIAIRRAGWLATVVIAALKGWLVSDCERDSGQLQPQFTAFIYIYVIKQLHHQPDTIGWSDLT